MTQLWKNKSAVAKFPKTVASLAMGELYPLCPRCKGSRTVIVCTQAGDGFRPSRSEYINCPLCHATGEAEAELAEEFILKELEMAE